MIRKYLKVHLTEWYFWPQTYDFSRGSGGPMFRSWLCFTWVVVE